MDPDFYAGFIGMQVFIDYEAADKKIIYIHGVLGKIVENKLIILHHDGRVKGFIDISTVVNIRAEEFKGDSK